MRFPDGTHFRKIARTAPHAQRRPKISRPSGQAREIRLRAERKAGQLPAQMENAKTGPAQNQVTSMHLPVGPPPLTALQISKRQSSDWQKLGAGPQEEFDQAIGRQPGRSLAGIHIPLGPFF